MKQTPPNDTAEQHVRETRRKENAQELGGSASGSSLVQLGEGDRGRPVDGDKQIELSHLGFELRYIDVELADEVGVELPSRRLVAPDVRQSGNAVPLEAAIQRGSR